MSKAKIFLKTIPLNPFPLDLDVVICSDRQASEKHLLNNYFLEPESAIMGDGGGLTLSGAVRRKCGCERVVLCAIDFNIRVLIHEIIHVTWALYRKCGPMFNVDNQEPQAYFADFIYDEIMKMK